MHLYRQIPNTGTCLNHISHHYSCFILLNATLHCYHCPSYILAISGPSTVQTAMFFFIPVALWWGSIKLKC